MDISTFDDLLRAARAQTQPQRLLFVFAAAELPDGCTPEERARFEAGEGGALTPVMSVDKSPDELANFAALADESRQFGGDWAVVFAAGLAGRDGRAPNAAEAGAALDRMIAAIKVGALESFMPFDRTGSPIVLA